MNFNLTPEHLDAIATVVWTWAVAFLPRLATAIAILVAGFVVARWASRAAVNLTNRAGHIDVTVSPIIGSIIRYSVLILVFVAALTQLGVQTTSLLAVLGAAGLAIGLALQGTLSNIAAGLMLLWLRPFHIGDFIEVGAISGVVRKVDLFACHLETFDGIFVFAPNSALWNNTLKNHSRNDGRLVSIDVTLGADADLQKARGILLKLVSSDKRFLQKPVPGVFVGNVTGDANVLNIQVWVGPHQIAEVQRSLIEAAKQALETSGDEHLKPRQIQRIVPPDNDPSRFMSV